MLLLNKFSRLKRIIGKYRSVLIAFSGGQDSAFLLKACALTLPADKILAVTAVSQTYPASELAGAKKIARQIGVRHKIIRTSELLNQRFVDNSFKRCYFCKQELFTRLKILAKRYRLAVVAEASSLSDQNDFRPGNIAKGELKVKSPLLEAGLRKADIRELSRRLGLSSWNKPSLACLASRVPYGIRINSSLLKRIEQAEAYLNRLGFQQVRLRHYQDLCRIEVGVKEIPRLCAQRKKIVKRLKAAGYHYVTADLQGYRTGSLNEVIPLWRKIQLRQARGAKQRKGAG